MKDYLTVAKIIDSFSLDGSLKVISSSSNKELRYKKGNKLFLKKNEDVLEVTVSSYRKSGNLDILHFEEIDTIDKASLYKGYEIVVEKNQDDLNEGYYFYSDLRDCEVINEGKILGKVIEVEEFPAQVTLRAKTKEGKQFFIPFIKQFIKAVDIKNKKIEINYMEGMIWK